MYKSNISSVSTVRSQAVYSGMINMLKGLLAYQEEKEQDNVGHATLSASELYLQNRPNTSNAELNPICHLLALLGAHHILHVSRVRVNIRLKLSREI